jgi:hypothetical protein
VTELVVIAHAQWSLPPHSRSDGAHTWRNIRLMLVHCGRALRVLRGARIEETAKIDRMSKGTPYRIVITCGPSFEPIDEVRRLTNSSTGELGVLLTQSCVRAGFEVTCFRGVGSTFSTPVGNANFVPFTTNEHLAGELRSFAHRDSATAVFHAAALADFELQEVRDAAGLRLEHAKIPSDTAEVVVTLKPARKLIGELRALFPNSWIVGWKYALEGSRSDAFTVAGRQMERNQTNACVLNGRAYGAGFGICEPRRAAVHCADKPELCAWLVRRLLEEDQPRTSPLAC